ncbi:MAG: hypothetical protein QM747_09720 [Nocardioides sp.]
MADVAARTGRTAAEVDAMIGPTAYSPGDDQALAALAQQLSQLDTEVSHR